MTDYKPGTVAKATVRGVPDVVVMRDDAGWWISPLSIEGDRYHGADVVIHVRPMILLSLESPAYTIEALRESATHKIPECGWSYDETLPALADQIEAQIKPPRIPEPGLWGVVEAGTDGIPTRRWVHHEEDRWVCDTGERRNWEALSDPTLVREGVES